MRFFSLDFETYWSAEYTLSRMTTEEYVRDPRFQTIGVSLVEFGAHARSTRAWLSHEQFLHAARHVIDWSDTALLCHHAHFDGLILSHHYKARPAYWFDTLSMANAIYGPGVAKSLEKIAEREGVGQKGKEVQEFKGWRYENFLVLDWARYGQYCLNDSDLTILVFARLLNRYPEKCRAVELELIDAQIRAFTEPEIELDVPRMQEFLEYERGRKAALLEATGHDRSVFASNDKFASLLVSLGVEPEMKLSPAALKRGETEYTYAFAKSDSFMKGLLEHPDPDVRAAAECRVGVKSTTNETRTERFLATAARGPLPVYYKYAVAHTFRNGGGDKMNWTNLERTNKKNPRKGVIRKSVRAPEGKVFVKLDSSQIEARITAVLAGEQWLIDAFAQGRDIYSEFASDIWQRPVDRKARPEDELPGFVGKVCILGLGYQMGWPKLALTFLLGALGGEPIAFDRQMIETLNIDAGRFLNNPKKIARAEIPCRLTTNERLIHCIVSEEIVKRYRQKNKNIVSLWSKADEILRLMWSTPQGERVPLDLPVPLAVVYHGLELPNGMVLRYPGLEYRDGVGYSFNGGLSGREREYTYGGKLVENIVQALARIVVMYQIAACRRKYGYKLVLTTYDEGVMLVPSLYGAEAFQNCLREFQTPPEWAPQLPVAAEGGFGAVYGEIK